MGTTALIAYARKTFKVVTEQQAEAFCGTFLDHYKGMRGVAGSINVGGGGAVVSLAAPGLGGCPRGRRRYRPRTAAHLAGVLADPATRRLHHGEPTSAARRERPR
jgi:hypothetical protein